MASSIRKINTLDMAFFIKLVDKITFLDYYNLAREKREHLFSFEEEKQIKNQFEKIVQNIEIDKFYIDYNVFSMFEDDDFKIYGFLPINIINNNIYIMLSKFTANNEILKKLLNDFDNIIYYETSDELINSYLEVLSSSFLSRENQILQIIDNIDKYFEKLILQSIKLNATDIHISNLIDASKIEFRINGEIHVIDYIEKNIGIQLVRKIKLMAGLDIANNLLPQSGSFIYLNKVNFRVSSIPTIYGDKLTLRILKTYKNLTDFRCINFENHISDIYKMINKPSGLIIFSGGTGSGKSTTIYSILNYLNVNSKRKIYTLENPVEVILDGLCQIEINEKVGLTYEVGLSSILQNDLDILFIDEVLDSNVARTTVRASMTGHLVFTSMHLSHIGQLFYRFMDFGVSKTELISVLQGVVFQSLIQELCPDCKKKYKAREYEKQILGGDAKYLYKRNPNGCEKCIKGVKKQRPIYRIIYFNDELKENLYQATNVEKILSQYDMDKNENPLKKLIKMGKVDFKEIFLVGEKFC